MNATPIVRKENIFADVAHFGLSMSATPLIEWPGFEEVDTSMPWHNADIVLAQRMAAVKAFAKDVLDLTPVEGVWLREAVNGLEVCVVVAEIDLDFDLALRERFIELVSERLGPGEGDLFIYQKDIAPHWVFQSKRLHA